MKGRRSDRLKAVAVVTAAGAGERMGTAVAKQFLEIDGRPLLAVTLEKFQHCPEIEGIVVVVPSDAVEYCRTGIIEPQGLTKVVKVVAGGARRQDSVRKGLEASGGSYGLVVIHDGVRPFVDIGLIGRAVEAARRWGAVITALPARETVKQVDEDGLVRGTIDRRHVWMVQTPQVFPYEDIIKAHRRAQEEAWDDVTDDAMLMERMGIPVKVIEGMEDNIKVTTPRDLALARFILERAKFIPILKV